jgi:alginate O-acetyltransferase complex protein AlgI
VALFPDLVAGPIIRYKTLAAQLASREITRSRFASGVAIFIIGFGKKILLANPAGEVADAVFNASGPMALDAWLGVFAYSIQIYFDFCGYSDMAVGLGRMLGFEFLRNFDAPYRSESITEVWRRWHVSLSNVLRDYLYFPLGGNQKGPTRTYINLLVVMLLGGLWHGASWNFVFWGAYHGMLLALERWRGKLSWYEFLPHPVRIGLTFLLILLGWVLFRAPDLPSALHYYSAMIFGNPFSPASAFLGAGLYTPYKLVLLALGGFLVFQRLQAHDWALKPQTWGRACLLLPLFGVSLMVMFAQSFNPFLYFQF